MATLQSVTPLQSLRKCASPDAFNYFKTPVPEYADKRTEASSGYLTVL